jgi:transcriptional antiterminator RfaH
VAYWACVQLESNRERLALHCLGLAGYQVYFPRIQVRKLKTAALFPGYAFVLIQMQWHAARWSPGVIRLVLDGMQPARVPDKVIADIRGRERNGLVELAPAPGFRRGDQVRIKRGVFIGQLAVFEGMRPHDRVAVLLQLLGSQRPVAVAKGDVVKVN